jgi:P27 family predicted phage terminase small subunit
MSGPRGPRPIPTHLQVLRGNPGHKKLSYDEPRPLIPDDVPEPPDFLCPYGQDEWHRIVLELHRLGLLTIVDYGPLAAYSQAYGTWKMAEEALAKMRSGDPVFQGLLVKRDKQAHINPLLSIARKAAGDMCRYASEFGMTPAARSRIAAGVGEAQQSKFAGLLAS